MTPDELREKVARAIVDPAAVVGAPMEHESSDEWRARAALAVTHDAVAEAVPENTMAGYAPMAHNGCRRDVLRLLGGRDE